jgi:hypothetical protein
LCEPSPIDSDDIEGEIASLSFHRNQANGNFDEILMLVELFGTVKSEKTFAEGHQRRRKEKE